MDRRDFFRAGLRKASRTAVEQAGQHVARRARHWIRPPWALDELEFLLACTRCDACIEACPHQTVFALPMRLGPTVAGTPALDLLNHPCHLCEDWPCTTACEPGALRLPEVDEDEQAVRLWPRLAVARIDTGRCLPWQGPECGACQGACPVPGAMHWSMERPRIDPARCTGCALCLAACITEPRAITLSTLPEPDTP